MAKFFKNPPSRSSLALQLGALALMAYFFVKQQTLRGDVINEFEKSENYSLRHIDPKIRAEIENIETIDDFNRWADENISNAWTRFWAKQKAKMLLASSENAVFTLSDVPSAPAILSHPDLVNKKVEAHEIGHYLDAIQHGALTRKEFTKKVYKPTRSMLYSIFKDPKGSAAYKAEQRAWEHVGIKKGDPLRSKALATYEHALKGERFMIPATAAFLLSEFV